MSDIEVFRITPEELKRREAFLQDGLLPYDATNPYSWSFPARMTLVGTLAGIGGWCLYNTWYRMPWHAALVPRAAIMLAGSTAVYWVARARQYNSASRDAVIDHYMQLHPDDFARTAEYNGRCFKDILLPWYPHRNEYVTYDRLKDFEKPR